jgi:hypothetical protein
MPPLLILSCDLGFCVCLLHFELLLFVYLLIWAYTTNLSYSSLHQWKIKYISLTIFLSVFTFNHCVRVQFALHFLQLWVQSNCEKIPINAKVLGKRAICISQILLFFLVHVTTLMLLSWKNDEPLMFPSCSMTMNLLT